MVGFALIWTASAVAYLLFAGQFSAHELAASAGCGLVAALWSSSLRRAVALHFRYERSAAAAVARAVGGLPSATWKVGFRLIRLLHTPDGGRRSKLAFIHGRVADPLDAGRRAIAVLALSLAPDSFVLRAPEGRDELDLHEFGATKHRGDDRWPL